MLTIIKLFFWLAVLYGIVGIILRFVKVSREVDSDQKDRFGDPIKKIVSEYVKLPMAYFAFFGGVITLILLSIIAKVGPQEVAVITTPNGVKEAPLHTGWHLVAPWNDVHFMDKTVWVYTCANSTKEGQKADADAIWAPTKDGIKMGFDVSVSWRIVAGEAPWIYQNVTENDGGTSGRYLWLEENVIRPKLKSNMALTVSNYTPIEAYSTKRQEIQDQVFLKMTNECKGYKLIIVNVDVREVYYNKEYEQSINNKKLAEQEALRLVEVTKQKEEQLKQAEIEKNIAIQRAEGEAKALQIKGASINANPKIIQLEWINKWNGQLPNYMMGNGQGIILDMGKQ